MRRAKSSQEENSIRILMMTLIKIMTTQKPRVVCCTNEFQSYSNPTCVRSIKMKCRWEITVLIVQKDTSRPSVQVTLCIYRGGAARVLISRAIVIRSTEASDRDERNPSTLVVWFLNVLFNSNGKCWNSLKAVLRKRCHKPRH